MSVGVTVLPSLAKSLRPHQEFYYFETLYNRRHHLCNKLEISMFQIYISDLLALCKREFPSDKEIQYNCNEIRKTQDELVNRNIRLAFRICYNGEFSKIRNVNNIDDMKQAAVLGLYPAISKFNHTLGIPFASYASFWVRKYVYQEVLPNTKYVPVGHLQSISDRQETEQRVQKIGINISTNRTRTFLAQNPDTEYYDTKEDEIEDPTTKITEQIHASNIAEKVRSFLLGGIEYTREQIKQAEQKYKKDRTPQNRIEYRKFCRELEKNIKIATIILSRNNVANPFYPINGHSVRVQDLARYYSIDKQRIYQLEKEARENLQKKFGFLALIT